MCKKFILTFTLLFTLSSCETAHDNKLLGKIIGSGLGALVGFQFGSGVGGALFIAGGTVLGGFIGNEIAEELRESFKNFNEAHDGQKALNLIKTGIELGVNFDLIISDWNMPGMTGLDLLKEVRAMENEIKDVPFLMITNETKQGNVVLAVQAGVNGYIGKPFSAHILYDKIKKLCTNE